MYCKFKRLDFHLAHSFDWARFLLICSQLLPLFLSIDVIITCIVPSLHFLCSNLLYLSRRHIPRGMFDLPLNFPKTSLLYLWFKSMFGRAGCVCGPHAAPLSDASLAQSGQPKWKFQAGRSPQIGIHISWHLRVSKTARMIKNPERAFLKHCEKQLGLRSYSIKTQ